MSVTWYEVWLADPGFLDRLYVVADQHEAESIHHFNDEPWHPGRPVVRILIGDERPIIDWLEKTGAGSIGRWDSSPDEELFGDDWPKVYRFFAAASRLAGVQDDWTYRKIVHCALNSWGFTVGDERKFAQRFARERKRMEAYDQKIRGKSAAENEPRSEVVGAEH